jgi:Glycosyl hydrolase family 65 central catalytic domain/Glycosyl hydrolase family 65, N-terminal domain
MKISRRIFVQDAGLLFAGSIPFRALADSRFPELSRLLRSWSSLTQQSRAAGTGHVPQATVTDFSQPYEPAYLSNGLIGIRPGANPLARSITQVSGFVYTHVPYGMQAVSPAPYPLETDIQLGTLDTALRALKNPDLVKPTRQTLDMSTGELTTVFTFAPGTGASLNIEVLQFASRSVPSLICQEIKLVASADTPVTLIPSIDSEGTLTTIYRSDIPARTDIDLVAGFDSNGNRSKLGVALRIETPDGRAHPLEPMPTDTALTRGYVVQLKSGQPFRFRTIAAMVSEMYHPEPALEAIRLASWGGMLGFDDLREANREAWNNLWLSRVKITGDTDAQRVIDCAFFYLHSSVHASTLTGMPPFGLSQATYYFGHSFWDTESWSLLPFALTDPAAARALVDFRVRSLDSAKRLAKLFGYHGAQFPWEAAPVGGYETTPTFAATGWDEQHCTPDVALGVWEYQLATNDEEFLHEGTWPVLRAVAQWIESRGIVTSRGFEIQHMMGPDEGVPNINNNSYMNLVCKMALAAAIRCAQMVGVAPPPSWAKIHDAIVIPIDPAKNIVLPYDNPPPPSSSNYSVGGLDFLTVHDPPISQELVRSTFAAEQTPRKRPAGALMGNVPHPIGFAVAAMAATAAFVGDRARAAQFFNESWQDSWLPPWGMIQEVSTEHYGCFLTDFGSILQTVMLGFTGIRVRDGSWAKYPASLPRGWTQIEMERFWMRGRPVHMIATDGTPAKFG